MADEEQDRGFKIQDKRRFDASGNPRPDDESDRDGDAVAEARREAPTAAQPTYHEREVQEELEEQEEPERTMHKPQGERRGDELTFSSFVVGLASQAFMFLGLAPDPSSGVVHRDLGQARAMIGVLSMLEAKTRGNRTEDEDRMMEELLYELRMSYVREVRGDDRPEGKNE